MNLSVRIPHPAPGLRPGVLDVVSSTHSQFSFEPRIETLETFYSLASYPGNVSLLGFSLHTPSNHGHFSSTLNIVSSGVLR